MLRFSFKDWETFIYLNNLEIMMLPEKQIPDSNPEVIFFAIKILYSF